MKKHKSDSSEGLTGPWRAARVVQAMATVSVLILALTGCEKAPGSLRTLVRFTPTAKEQIEPLQISPPPHGEQVVTFEARYPGAEAREGGPAHTTRIIPAPQPMDLVLRLPSGCAVHKAPDESTPDELHLSPPISGSETTVLMARSCSSLSLLVFSNPEHDAWDYADDPTELVQSFGSELAFLRQALNTVPEDVKPLFGHVSRRAVALLNFKLCAFSRGVFRELKRPGLTVLLCRVYNHVNAYLFDGKGTGRCGLLFVFPEGYDPADAERTVARLLWHAELVEPAQK